MSKLYKSVETLKLLNELKTKTTDINILDKIENGKNNYLKYYKESYSDLDLDSEINFKILKTNWKFRLGKIDFKEDYWSDKVNDCFTHCKGVIDGVSIVDDQVYYQVRIDGNLKIVDSRLVYSVDKELLRNKESFDFFEKPVLEKEVVKKKRVYKKRKMKKTNNLLNFFKSILKFNFKFN